MATILTGDVEILRIWELLGKVLSSGDLANYSIAIDNKNDTTTYRIPLDKLKLLVQGAGIETIVGGDNISVDDTDPLNPIVSVIGLDIYKPTTEPAIVSGTPNMLTFDCNNRQQAKFAPRLSVGTLSINVDHTIALSNTTGTEVISFAESLTGTRIITFPSGTLAADIPSAYTWSSLALTIPAGTDEIYEFSLNKYGSNWLLRVGGVNA